MVYLVKERGRMKARVLKLSELPSIADPSRCRVLAALAEPSYPSEIARRLGMSEQQVHYHINQLQRFGAISLVRTEKKRGGTAKYFVAKDPAFAVVFNDSWEPVERRVGTLPTFLADFYPKGSFEGCVIVGSPEPHGPYQASARDAFYAADLCLYLGSLSERVEPSVRLDTEVRENELRSNNLVVVGGPVVNMIAARVNDDLPVRILTGDRWAVHSAKTGKSYFGNAGMLVVVQNPWNADKSMLVVAGASRGGTKAAILAMMRHPGEFSELRPRIVDGLDFDGDGVVDDVVFKE